MVWDWLACLTLKRGVTLPLRDLVDQVEGLEVENPRGIIDLAAVRGVALGKLNLKCLRDYLDDCFGELQAEMRVFQGNRSVYRDGGTACGAAGYGSRDD